MTHAVRRRAPNRKRPLEFYPTRGAANTVMAGCPPGQTPSPNASWPACAWYSMISTQRSASHSCRRCAWAASRALRLSKKAANLGDVDERRFVFREEVSRFEENFAEAPGGVEGKHDAEMSLLRGARALR